MLMHLTTDTDMILSRIYMTFFSALFMTPALYILPALFKSVNTFTSLTALPARMSRRLRGT